MAAYYNEFDPFAAAWLRELIKAGHIADGEVDERSIKEVGGSDLARFTQCHFFAGIGGWSYALRLAGWPDHRPVWTGSCPCQPFSLAGSQKGFADDRHLWPEFKRLIEERRPATIFGEQVASATAWLGLVRGDLEAMDYAVGAMPIEAASAGADHLRDRFWFVGNDTRDGRGEGRAEHEVRSGRATVASNGSLVNAEGERRYGSENPAWPDRRDGVEATGRLNVAHSSDQGPSRSRRIAQPEGAFLQFGDGSAEEIVGSLSDSAGEQVVGAGLSWEHSSVEWAIGSDGKARRVKPGIRLLANGIPNRVGKLRGLGNAIDPRPAASFIQAADEAMTSLQPL